MSVEVFLDTNILVYAASRGTQDEQKRRRALELIKSENFGTSAQVLQEFFVTAMRRGTQRLSVAQALEWIEQFLALPCKAIDERLVRIGIDYSQRYKISYWDAAILAAAEALGAHTVYTEDLNDGQQYGAVRVVNPFR